MVVLAIRIYSEMFKGVFYLHQNTVFTAYSHATRGDVSPFARENFMFCGISSVVFPVITSGGVFRLSVSCKSKFLPAVQTICCSENFIRIR